jgi:hypothetical protein
VTSPTNYGSTDPRQEVTQQVRNVGSGYTTFQYAGQAIAYLDSFTDSGQKPVAAYDTIHPLDEPHPTDFVTSRALGAGTIDVSIRELWHQEVWEQLVGLEGTKTISDIFARLASTPQYVTCTKLITPPYGAPYGKTYHKCVIVDITDNEQVMIGQLSVAKGLTIAYTHTTSF